MFSDAISSISWRCRPSSPLMAAAISGSASASVAVKNESGAEAVLAELAGGFIGEYLHRRRLLRLTGGHVWRSKAASRRLAYRGQQAKRLRLLGAIYARYGGMRGFLEGLAFPGRSAARRRFAGWCAA